MAAHVQSNSAASAGTVASIACTFDSTTVTGNSIAVFVLSRNPAGSDLDFTVTDNKGNTYVERQDPFAGGSDFLRGCYIATVSNFTGGSSHEITATLASGTQQMSIVIVEVSGVETASFDQAVVSSDMFEDPVVNPTTGTLATSSSILFACTGTEASTTAAGGSWTEVLDDAAATFPARVQLQYQIVTSTSAVSNNCDLDVAQNAAAGIVVFKATIPPPPTIPYYNIFPKVMLRY